MTIEKATAALRRELETRRSAIQDELARIDAALAALGPLDGPTVRDAAGWTDLGIVAASRRLLEEAGRPLKTRELADEMKRRGVRTKAAHFMATVYTVLRESPHFEYDSNLKKWQLRGMPPQPEGLPPPGA